MMENVPMKYFISLVLLAFAANNVYATGYSYNSPKQSANSSASAYSSGYNHNYNNNSATADGGNASSFAKGGSARVTNRNGQDQGQSQYQGNVGINGQSLSGVGSGNDTSVSVVGGDTNVDAPAIAPSVSPGNPTAPCIATWSVTGGIPALSLGGSGYVRDSVCTWGEVSRVAREAGNSDLANKALILMFEEAERQTGTVASLTKEEARKEVATESSVDGFSALDAIQ